MEKNVSVSNIIQIGKDVSLGDSPYLSFQRLLLNLPAAGNRNNTTGASNNQGTNGNYWSSSVSGTNASRLNFNATGTDVNANNRANGFSVRCVQELAGYSYLVITGYGLLRPVGGYELAIRRLVRDDFN